MEIFGELGIVWQETNTSEIRLTKTTSGSQAPETLTLPSNGDNLIAAIITPDKDIIPNSENLEPAYIVFENYEKILQWNRSLRFALAVCTLKGKFEDVL